ncbi:unnamed protein product [Ostreobium quekettii]|uniref:Adenosylmethionine-8-amino-7-oxononanoate aminotransferase n=1 Tax=Ostreobium quekettii TaxID=121088 RepID=A0A8S1IVV9_9CHLO|nr:unnamed protein product [Ostreobium quekettii]
MWGLRSRSWALARYVAAAAPGLLLGRSGDAWPAVLLRGVSSGTGGPSGRRDLSLPNYIVFGSNTGVGKTAISAGLARTCTRQKECVVYIKPVQTGWDGGRSPASNSDAHTVASVAQETAPGGSAPWKDACRDLMKFDTLYAYQQPVSPHLAAQLEEGNTRIVSDAELTDGVAAKLTELAGTSNRKCLGLVEAAGGVASPVPSGALQCDVYRSLQLPCLLVGDHRLGGISATISAYDSLVLRGYDVAAIALFAGELANHLLIREHFDKCIHSLGEKGPSIVVIPEPKANDDHEEWVSSTKVWADTDGRTGLEYLLDCLRKAHGLRRQILDTARGRAKQCLWWPFTQHSTVQDSDVTVIDARCGEHFSVFSGGNGNPGFLEKQYDGCASWWTQGTGAAMQFEIARTVALAAGRYGHVLFPENTHEAGLRCSEHLLSSVGSGWASKVFYSDDGSTAVEVALKMALRTFAKRHHDQMHQCGDLKILGMSNSYHGDTLGAMDACPSSIFNRGQTPWYVEKGVFVQCPTVSMLKGRWQIRLPEELKRLTGGSERQLSWEELDGVFNPDRSDLEAVYLKAVASVIDGAQGHKASGGATMIGACLLEPVVQAAGGMILVDPVFQRCIVKVCRERGIPVIFDEVFTGFWRLGAAGGASLLGMSPDIACYAKLLTGGVVPLAATLSTEEVFEAFAGPSKAEALLHGHSFTAHPIGCAAACAAISMYTDPSLNPNLQRAPASVEMTAPPTTKAEAKLMPLWDSKAVRELSSNAKVDGITAIGTLLAVELKPPEGQEGGYGSGVAVEVVKKLRANGVYTRPLGNVVYLMCAPVTPKEECDRLLALLSRLL